MQQLTEPSEAAEIRSCDVSSPVQGTRAGCLKYPLWREGGEYGQVTPLAGMETSVERGPTHSFGALISVGIHRLPLWRSISPFSPVKLLSGWYLWGGELSFDFPVTSPKNQGDRILFVEVTMWNVFLIWIIWKLKLFLGFKIHVPSRLLYFVLFLIPSPFFLRGNHPNLHSVLFLREMQSFCSRT